MKKFNWDEFKNKDNKIAVNCKTEEEAKDFCKQMHEHGMKWCNGESYLKNTNYNTHHEGTCYYGNGEYSSRDFAEKYNYKILECGDYMQKKFTKSDLKDYNENLKSVVSDLEIVRVYKIKRMGKISSIMYDGNLELIWERKEPKKMTVEEMRKKLEELTGEEIEVMQE